ncbi:MAG TPA: hypothetical protein VE956_05385 [Nodularia sp. (in: cyanobacteria)]|nr:hypothetical protein [Nodularia sp. (in: cyanobacteria)]
MEAAFVCIVATFKRQKTIQTSSNLDFIHFFGNAISIAESYVGQWFYLLTSSILCDVEKVFAKKPGFLPGKETEFLILDKVELMKQLGRGGETKRS